MIKHWIVTHCRLAMAWRNASLPGSAAVIETTMASCMWQGGYHL